jgi:hypothetical protein
MANDAAKLVKAITDEAERQGFDVRRPGREGAGHGQRHQKNQHIKVYAPNGGPWITNFPLTPGNDAKRSVLNSLAPLKRAGFIWPAPKRR